MNLTNLNINKPLVINASGEIATTAVTNTEFEYLDGVTSGVQTQLDAKGPAITGGATTITTSDLTVNRALLSDGSGKAAISTVTNTELGYVSGVTSSLQTQLNGISAGSGTFNTSSLMPINNTNTPIVGYSGVTPNTIDGQHLQIATSGNSSFCGIALTQIAKNLGGVQLNVAQE